MTPTEQSIPAWKVWSNPIFRRYCRSRLRPRGLGVALLIAFLLAAFIFSMARSTALYQADMALADAERTPLIPLLVLQAVILFVIGTAQVGGGMTAERDEGVIDYQRLIPMSPLSKVLGYLFGLPIREYAMFAITLPFTAWGIWRGEVEAATWVPVYAVLFSSTLLYHFTGLVTGTVVKNRRWAFLISIGLVLCLYTIIPQMARFGLVFFEYLTISPVVMEQSPGLLPRTMGEVVALGQRLAPTVKFFNLDFSETVFTLFSQGGLIATFLVMLCRKWRRSEAHLLGKRWAVLLFIWIQVLLLGNALPVIDTGSLFPSKELTRMARIPSSWEPQPYEAVGMAGVYGLVTLLILFVMILIITPTLEHQVLGWRRGRKRKERSLPFFSDAAGAFLFTVVMAIAGGAGWYLFTEGIVESRWFPGHHVGRTQFLMFLAVMLAAGIGFQALLEWRGGRALGLAVILAGVLPIMAGTVVGTVGGSMIAIGAWVIGISPVSLPIYAAGSLLSLAELPYQVGTAVPRAFVFWLFVSALVACWLLVRLRRAKKAMAAGILGAPADDGSAPGP